MNALIITDQHFTLHINTFVAKTSSLPILFLFINVFLQLVAVLKAIGRDDLVHYLDEVALPDIVDFLLPFDKSGEIPGGVLEKLQRHITSSARD